MACKSFCIGGRGGGSKKGNFGTRSSSELYYQVRKCIVEQKRSFSVNSTESLKELWYNKIRDTDCYTVNATCCSVSVLTVVTDVC